MATARSRWLVAVAGLAMLTGGCGSSTPAAGSRATPVAVIRAWSDALRRGDVNAAARYFALPSEFFNGTNDAISIHTEAQAQAVNASLPCGAMLISTTHNGRFVTALFRLTDRPGPNGGCGTGTGGLVRTNFIIAHGHIVEWIRATDPTPAGGPVV